MNVKAIRRANLRQLAKEVGGIGRLADKLDKPQSQLSHLIGIRPIKQIGDKIAAEVEAAFNKPLGWLDHSQGLDYEPEKSIALSNRENNTASVLCQQVPLILWKDIPTYLGVEKSLPNVIERVTTTVKVSPLSFALMVYGDSMESGSGISFSEGQIIIIDPEPKAQPEDFVVVQIQPGREATLKQLIYFDSKHHLKPLNRRYPCLDITPQIWGVVKQLVMNV